MVIYIIPAFDENAKGYRAQKTLSYRLCFVSQAQAISWQRVILLLMLRAFAVQFISEVANYDRKAYRELNTDILLGRSGSYVG